MKTKIIKLDKRYNGSDHFVYMATPKWQTTWTNVDTIDNIRQMREWCWNTFGPSCEYSEYAILANNGRDVNERWSWLTSNKFRSDRILIKNEEDRNWFALRWS